LRCTDDKANLLANLADHRYVWVLAFIQVPSHAGEPERRLGALD
jgi:hypothetical protein